MLTRMTDADWDRVVQVFRAVRSRRGGKGRNDRRFREAVHYFCVHNITWRALPAECGNWNSIGKRFWRLSQAGVFEAFFDALTAMSQTAHLVQMFDSTVVRAHVGRSAARSTRAWPPEPGRPQDHGEGPHQHQLTSAIAQARGQGLGGEPSRPIVWPMIVIDARWQIEAAPDEHTELR